MHIRAGAHQPPPCNPEQQLLLSPVFRMRASFDLHIRAARGAASESSCNLIHCTMRARWAERLKTPFPTQWTVTVKQQLLHAGRHGRSAARAQFNYGTFLLQVGGTDAWLSFQRSRTHKHNKCGRSVSTNTQSIYTHKKQWCVGVVVCCGVCVCKKNERPSTAQR